MTFGWRYVPQNLARLMTASRVAVLAMGAARGLPYCFAQAPGRRAPRL